MHTLNFLNNKVRVLKWKLYKIQDNDDPISEAEYERLLNKLEWVQDEILTSLFL